MKEWGLKQVNIVDLNDKRQVTTSLLTVTKSGLLLPPQSLLALLSIFNGIWLLKQHILVYMLESYNRVSYSIYIHTIRDNLNEASSLALKYTNGISQRLFSYMHKVILFCILGDLQRHFWSVPPRVKKKNHGGKHFPVYSSFTVTLSPCLLNMTNLL